MRPKKRGIAVSRNRAGPAVVGRAPLTMANAVPTVGRSAASPGNGVVSLSTIPARTVRATPNQPAAAATRSGIRSSRLPATARRPPRASSQARAGSEKSAQGWAAGVNQNAKTCETPAMATSAIPTR